MKKTSQLSHTVLVKQPSSRDSGYPDWEQDQWPYRNRAGSVSGSDGGSRLTRKLSNTSCPPAVRGMPHSTSVCDLNNAAPHHHHGFVPMQQVRQVLFHSFDNAAKIYFYKHQMLQKYVSTLKAHTQR